MKKKIFAVKRGNHPLEIPFAAPAIFIQEKEGDDWKWYEGCHDPAVLEADLQEMLNEHWEVEHFYEDSKFFEDDEQIDIDDIDLENELKELE